MRILRLVTLVPMLCVLAGLTACAAPEAELAPPAESVQRLLELRMQRSEDASQYAPYVKEPGLATELAESAKLEAGASTAPIPEWETPFVSQEDSSTAEVVVVWLPAEAFSDWPPATVFKMELVDDGWVSVDAIEIEESTDVPPRPE